MQLRTIKNVQVFKSIKVDILSIDHRSGRPHVYKTMFAKHCANADIFFPNYFNKQIYILKREILGILGVQETMLIWHSDCDYEQQVWRPRMRMMPTCFFELVSCYMYNHSVIVVLFTLLQYQANPQTLLGEKH